MHITRDRFALAQIVGKMEIKIRFVHFSHWK